MEFLTISEAATRLGIPTSTLAYYCRVGHMGRKATGVRSRAWLLTEDEVRGFRRKPRGRKPRKTAK